MPIPDVSKSLTRSARSRSWCRCSHAASAGRSRVPARYPRWTEAVPDDRAGRRPDTSPSRANSRAAASCGRSVRVPLIDSSNTRSHPGSMEGVGLTIGGLQIGRDASIADQHRGLPEVSYPRHDRPAQPSSSLLERRNWFSTVWPAITGRDPNVRGGACNRSVKRGMGTQMDEPEEIDFANHVLACSCLPSR
jgi:hypothetical protein